MGAVREGLLRLSDATAAARARGWARAWHTRVLLAATALAWLLPLPGLDALRGRWLAAFAAAAGLVAVGFLLRVVARPWLRTRPDRLAARLDDERGWKDATSTALEVERQPAASPVGAYLVAHAVALVGTVQGPAAVAVRRGRPWLRIALVVLFLAALLLPGVNGMLGLPGVGHHPNPTAMDWDDWLREHSRLRVDRVPADEEYSLRLQVSFRTIKPLPAAYSGDVILVWDGLPRGVLGVVEAGSGELAEIAPVWDLAQIKFLEGLRRTGEHRAFVRLVPKGGPFTVALICDPAIFKIPPGGGGGGAQPPPQPPPEPPPPEPPPTPQPTPEGNEEAPKPPPSGREEAVKPLINEGDTVKKDSAVVEVEDPNAGTKPPPAVPLAEALRDFDRLVERAVGTERIQAWDRDYLRRYFRALQRLVAPVGTPPK
jgi:hypothetical protein